MTHTHTTTATATTCPSCHPAQPVQPSQPAQPVHHHEHHSAVPASHVHHSADPSMSTGSWFSTYKPLLLIFGYLLLISMMAARPAGVFNIELAMRVFMSGFFLTFSFFKMLDLPGFADSYATYDIIARRF